MGWQNLSVRALGPADTELMMGRGKRPLSVVFGSLPPVSPASQGTRASRFTRRRVPPTTPNAKAGLHLLEPDRSHNHRLVRKLLAFQQRLINSDSIKSILINYAERYYCRLYRGIIIGLSAVCKNEM